MSVLDHRMLGRTHMNELLAAKVAFLFNLAQTHTHDSLFSIEDKVNVSQARGG